MFEPRPRAQSRRIDRASSQNPRETTWQEGGRRGYKFPLSSPTNAFTRETGTDLLQKNRRSNSGRQVHTPEETTHFSKRKKITKILEAVDQKEGDYDFSIESNVEKFKFSHLKDIGDETPGSQDLTLLHRTIFEVPEGASYGEVFTRRRELLSCLLGIEIYRDLFSKGNHLLSGIKDGRNEFVFFILENFWDLASATLEDEINITCMHAEFERLADCVDLLVHKSQLKNDIVKAQDEKGNTLLHIAVHFRESWTATIPQNTLIEHLLKACPRALTTPNKDGQSPYQYYLGSLPQSYSPPPDESRENITIGFLLKNYYMRCEQRDETIRFLYGNDRDRNREIEFDLREFAGRNNYITGDYLSKLSRLFESAAKFESILRYVDLPRFSIESIHDIPPFSNLQSQTRNYRQQYGMSQKNFGKIFDWLYEHGVRKIIKVVVEDDEDAPHSDEVIENTLRRFGVEIWDWRKFDLCSETILEAAPDVEDISLYSSGNRAVLRSWSGEDGLKKLQKLRRIHISIYQRLESIERTKASLKEFKTRLQKQCPQIQIESEIVGNTRHRDHTRVPRNPQIVKSVESTHYWLDSMDNFATFIRNIDVNVKEEVKVAIIDDGVDGTHEAIFRNIACGISYCNWPDSENHTKAYYLLTSNHGTQMASLICRICPTAKLYIARLCEGEGDHGKRQITTASAVKAIEWAIKQEVHIISMSWSLASDPSNPDLEYLKKAIRKARNKNILMFSSTSDQGSIDDGFCPGSYTDVICIGAAKSTGNKSEWVQPDQTQYLCPGEDVKVEVNSIQGPASGSSIATALAAGLAALILHCVDIYCADPEIQGNKSGLRETLQDLDNMKTIFDSMARDKYIRVFDFFGREFRDAEWEDKGRKEFVKLISKLFQKIRQLEKAQ